MPYIPQEDRRHYTEALHLICNRLDQRQWHPGHLTYVLYYIAVQAIRSVPKSYSMMSRVRASVQDTADELYRSEMADYEDQKIKENGRV